jgi:hypothetical protein
MGAPNKEIENMKNDFFSNLERKGNQELPTENDKLYRLLSYSKIVVDDEGERFQGGKKEVCSMFGIKYDDHKGGLLPGKDAIDFCGYTHFKAETYPKRTLFLFKNKPATNIDGNNERDGEISETNAEDRRDNDIDFVPKETAQENIFSEFKEVYDNSKITETEKETLVKARIGQGLFREKVITEHKKCPITEISNPAFLKAGHIKPWAECENDEERMDPLNGLALSPVADLLVDKGFITFDDKGTVVFSEELDSADLKAMGIDVSKNYQIEIKDPRQLKYIQYHRRKYGK